MRCVSEKTLARIARMLTGLPLTASLLTAQPMTEEKEAGPVSGSAASFPPLPSSDGANRRWVGRRHSTDLPLGRYGSGRRHSAPGARRLGTPG